VKQARARRFGTVPAPVVVGPTKALVFALIVPFMVVGGWLLGVFGSTLFGHGPISAFWPLLGVRVCFAVIVLSIAALIIYRSGVGNRAKPDKG